MSAHASNAESASAESEVDAPVPGDSDVDRMRRSGGPEVRIAEPAGGVPEPPGGDSEAVAWRAAATTSGAALGTTPHLGFHLSWNLVADVLARGASLWLAFWAARALGVDGFGRLTLALAAAQWSWLAGDAVLNSGYATREVARDPVSSRDIATLFYGARALAGLALSVVYVPILWMLPLAPESRSVLAAAVAFFAGYGLYPDWLLRGRSEFRALATGNGIYAGVLVLLTLAVLPLRPDPALAVLVWGGGYGVAAAWMVRSLVRRGALGLRLPRSLGAWWPHARRSGLFSLGSIFSIGCAQALPLLVAALAGTYETGLFAPGFRLILGGLGVFSVLWWPLLPVLAGSPPESSAFRAAFGTIARVVLLVSLPLAIGLSLFAREILVALFGGSYAAGSLALAVGAWVLPLFAVTGMLEQTCLALGRERTRVSIYGAALALLVLASTLAVPRMGSAGASAAMVASYAFAVSAYGAVLRLRVPIAAAARHAIQPLLLNAALAGVWLVLSRVAHVPWWTALICGGLAYGVAVLFLSWTPWARSPVPRLTAVRSPLAMLPLLPERPLVSVLLAVRNESRHIEDALRAACAQDYDAERLEILVMDGDSDDDTASRARAIAACDPRVRVLTSPRRHVAAGLNLGLHVARGAIVVRVDGHCGIPPDYVRTCVATLRAGGAECVGGPVRAAGDTVLARAIASAMSSRFGVGGAAFRWATEARDVDHLPFGAWRREVFERLGGFDESLVRNQDDEFSDRLRRAGGRIRLLPSIPVVYWSRRDLGALWRQYGGYGFYKVAVMRKRGGLPASPRHLAPAALVFGLVGGAVLAAVSRSAVWLLPAWSSYALFLALAAFWAFVRGGGTSSLLVPCALATMHVSYGVGFLAGIAVALTTRSPRRHPEGQAS